jgi:transmembrane sensor
MSGARPSGIERRPRSAVRRALERPTDAPLHGVLSDRFEEPSVVRMWRGIDQRLSRRPSRAGYFAIAVAAAALVGAFAFALNRAPARGPLLLSAGGVPAVLEAESGTLPARFADGSRIELSRGSRVEVLRNDARSFVSVLRRGQGTFDVEPGGPRRWVVEAGLASVEVVGTRFSVARSAGRVDVIVERGAVVVRAETLPGGTRRLEAGQRVEVHAALAAGESAARTAAGPASVSHAAESLPTPLEALELEAAPPQPAASGASLRPSLAARPVASELDVDAHFAAADAARRRGDREAAARYLEIIIERAPASDPRRGMAALTLARLTVDAEPARAAGALDESMSDMPKSLAEDALARLVQAEGRAGRRENARKLAREYSERFPDGHRAEDVKRWAER